MAQKRTNTTATARLKQDYLRIIRDPVPYIVAAPLPTNILEWRYVVMGPEDSPYEGGFYHGKLVFPREFPFKPPSIYMTTPNGRFKVNSRLCLSISDFHPDTWNPAWSVSTILTGLLSFMLEKSPTFGSIETTDYAKRQLAAQSLEFNLKDKIFCEIFPDMAKEHRQILLDREAELRAAASAATSSIQSTTPAQLGYDDVRTPNQQRHQAGAAQGVLGGALTNIVVIVGFAAFALTVKYVLKSIAE